MPSGIYIRTKKRNEESRNKTSLSLMDNENGCFCRRYNVNINSFGNIENEKQAYWLGFIMADGYVSASKNNWRFGIKLAKRDFSHVNKLRRFLESFHPIKEIESNGKKYCVLQIASKYLVLNLIKLGVIPRKTWNLLFPLFVAKNLVRHFIRGYFDGDGWICLNKTGLTFGIMGRNNFLVSIQNYLMSSCKLNKTKLLPNKRSKNKDTKSLCYGGNNQCKRIYKYLYEDATIFLRRKKLVWEKICQA